MRLTRIKCFYWKTVLIEIKSPSLCTVDKLYKNRTFSLIISKFSPRLDYGQFE